VGVNLSSRRPTFSPTVPPAIEEAWINSTIGIIARVTISKDYRWPDSNIRNSDMFHQRQSNLNFLPPAQTRPISVSCGNISSLELNSPFRITPITKPNREFQCRSIYQRFLARRHR
jgi:hypothetical protein